MPCCTYLDDREVEGWEARLKDSDLRDLLVELNAIPGERWALQPINTHTRTRWMRRLKPLTLYALYCHIGSIEWQCINFPGGESSIHMIVEGRVIHTYLLGFLAGRWSVLRTPEVPR